MDPVIGSEQVILAIYPFPLTRTLPTKLCCRKMLVWKTAQFAEGLQQSSPEMPPGLVKCFKVVTNRHGRALQLSEDVLML